MGKEFSVEAALSFILRKRKYAVLGFIPGAAMHKDDITTNAFGHPVEHALILKKRTNQQDWVEQIEIIGKHFGKKPQKQIFEKGSRFYRAVIYI